MCHVTDVSTKIIYFEANCKQRRNSYFYCIFRIVRKDTRFHGDETPICFNSAKDRDFRIDRGSRALVRWLGRTVFLLEQAQWDTLFVDSDGDITRTGREKLIWKNIAACIRALVHLREVSVHSVSNKKTASDSIFRGERENDARVEYSCVASIWSAEPPGQFSPEVWPMSVHEPDDVFPYAKEHLCCETTEQAILGLKKGIKQSSWTSFGSCSEDESSQDPWSSSYQHIKQSKVALEMFSCHGHYSFNPIQKRPVRGWREKSRCSGVTKPEDSFDGQICVATMLRKRSERGARAVVRLNGGSDGSKSCQSISSGFASAHKRIKISRKERGKFTVFNRVDGTRLARCTKSCIKKCQEEVAVCVKECQVECEVKKVVEVVVKESVVETQFLQLV